MSQVPRNSFNFGLLTSIYVQSFQVRRVKFIEELESYTLHVGEFSSFGDLAEVPRYLKRAQFFSNKLQDAAERVSKNKVFKNFIVCSINNKAVARAEYVL